MRLSRGKLLRDRKVHTGCAGRGADQIGRWIGSVSILSQVSGRGCSRFLKPKVAELTRTQDKNGLSHGGKTTGDTTADRRI
jgi:hypothetical protein